MDQVPVIHETELKRRRSRVPWIYLVYHPRLRKPACHAACPAQAAPRRRREAAAAKAGFGEAGPFHPSC